jgi:hypothetical protein
MRDVLNVVYGERHYPRSMIVAPFNGSLFLKAEQHVTDGGPADTVNSHQLCLSKALPKLKLIGRDLADEILVDFRFCGWAAVCRHMARRTLYTSVLSLALGVRTKVEVAAV